MPEGVHTKSQISIHDMHNLDNILKLCVYRNEII